ncbi:MAG: CDP-alcohol phosphatidyltransferase family protein [Actinomycetes bacterium]
MSDLTETAVLVSATAVPGGPSAVLPYEGGTVLSRLLDQLDRLGADHHHLVVRREWASALGGFTSRATVHPYDDAAGLYAAVADLAGRPDACPLLVLPGDVVAHDDVLADLVADSRVRTAVLARSCPEGGPVPSGAGLRTDGGRVVSAGSSHHRVTAGDTQAPAALRVAPGDRAALAAAASRVADAARGWTDADADPVSLLTVALVRDGTAVTSVDMGGYAWLHPRSPQDARHAADRLGEVDTEGLRLESAVKGRDGFFTSFLVSPYSRYLARWGAQRGITPNQVTLASLAVGVVAAVALATGSRPGYVAGALLLQASFTLDCVDGQLARYSRSFSALGAWLDATFDRAKEYVVYVGLAIGASRNGDDVWVLAVVAMTLLTFRHTVDFGYAAATAVPPAQPVRLPFAQPDDTPPGDAGPVRARGRARGGGVVGAIGSVDRWRWVVWAKRMVILPIGERWALISLTIAFFDPRVTFVVLLVFGGFATAYTTLGRLVRTVAR